MIKKNIHIIVAIVSLVIIFLGNKLVTNDLELFKEDNSALYYKAKVSEIIDVVENNDIMQVTFTAKVLNGDFKNEYIDAVQNIDSYYNHNEKTVEVGDKIVVVDAEFSGGQRLWCFSNYLRTNNIYAMIAIFCVGLIGFGKSQGIRTIISLGLTCLAIFTVFVPSIMNLCNIYLMSILICIFIIVMTLLVVNGLSKKSLAAGISCFSGVLVAGILIIITDNVLKLTGVVDTDSLRLVSLSSKGAIDLNALIFAAVIIGALGAIMDVSISISSALLEIKENNDDITFNELYISGINIGRDIMGTMSNTLVLAYIGSSLSVTLLLVNYATSYLEFFNRERIVIEILQSIIGSIAILVAIPLTSFIASVLYTSKNTKG